MTEQKAWLSLADLWANAKFDSKEYYVYINGTCATGLCPAIANIGCVHVQSMLAKLSTHGPIPKYGGKSRHCWPLTLEGAKQRSKFCKEMAAKCPEET